MLDNIIKSTVQLRYELDNTKDELTYLLKNWEQKKESTAIKITAYRADLKQLEAVMATTEESYKAYTSLVGQILNITDYQQDKSEATFANEELAPSLSMPICQLIQTTRAAEQLETARILRAREVYKTQSEHIQRKSKESYVAMQAEKENVEAYTLTLTEKIQALNEQLQAQIKSSGMGVGL